MNNDKRFLIKFLGVFMIEIVNVTPEKIGKLLWQIAKILFIAIVLIQLPEYIQAVAQFL